MQPDRSASQRGAIRDSFEEIVNYITNITTTTTIEGDGSVAFFEVTTTSIGSASTVQPRKPHTPGLTATGRDFTIYDYSANKRFAQNFVDGFVGAADFHRTLPKTPSLSLSLRGTLDGFQDS